MCTKKKAIMPLYFILAMKWRLFKEEKRERKKTWSEYISFVFWHISCAQLELEKHVLRCNLEKCWCLWVFQPWLEPGSSKCDEFPLSISRKFYSIIFAKYYYYSTLSPSLLRYRMGLLTLNQRLMKFGWKRENAFLLLDVDINTNSYKIYKATVFREKKIKGQINPVFGFLKLWFIYRSFVEKNELLYICYFLSWPGLCRD